MVADLLVVNRDSFDIGLECLAEDGIERFKHYQLKSRNAREKSDDVFDLGKWISICYWDEIVGHHSEGSCTSFQKWPRLKNINRKRDVKYWFSWNDVGSDLLDDKDEWILLSFLDCLVDKRQFFFLSYLIFLPLDEFCQTVFRHITIVLGHNRLVEPLLEVVFFIAQVED